jgi:hypothetical protein
VENIVVVFLIAFFVQLKALEYKPEPILYPLLSVFSWLAFGVGIVMWLSPILLR